VRTVRRDIPVLILRTLQDLVVETFIPDPDKPLAPCVRMLTQLELFAKMMAHLKNVKLVKPATLELPKYQLILQLPFMLEMIVLSQHQ
jgi:hypothetical protein